MRSVAWLALAAAVWLAPTASALRGRVQGLTAGGRLASPVVAGAWWRARGASVSSPLAASGPVTALAGATAGALGWWLVGAAIGVAGAVAALTMSVIALGAIRQRTINRRRAATQRAIRLVIAELAAGSRPAEALKAGADALAELPDPAVADALRAAAAAAATGSEVDRALRADPELGALAGAWRVASTVGAPLVDVLSRTADDLAARAAQDRAVAAALAGPRSSAMVVAVLPVLGILLGAAMGAHPLTFLLHVPAGRLVCLVGVLFDSAGVLWTRRLVAGAAR